MGVTQQTQGFDAEAAVLGAMLIDAAVVPRVLGRLDARDFASDLHRTLFEAIRALFRVGEPVDAITAVDKAGWSQDVERRAFVAQLLETTPTSANALEYAAIVREQAILRELQTQAIAVETAPTLDACRAPLTAMTEALAAGQQIEAWTMEQMLTDFGDRQLAKDPKEYISIGIREIDENTFLERGDVLMLGGAPSDGKTALALNIAYHMAQRYNVGFYSLETGREKLEDRLVASGFGISFDAVKKGAMNEDDWTRFAEQSIEASKRRLTVLRASGMTVDQIASSSRARGFDVIFVDYGQLITPRNVKGVKRVEQMTEVSQALHTFAQSTRTLVVVLLQLTRLDRKDKRERDMFDLGETSQWEKDADLILLLYRPPEGTRFDPNDKSSEELDPEKTRILRIAKQKEGRRTRLPLIFDGDHQRFTVMQPDPKAAMRKFSAAGRAAKDRNRTRQSTFWDEAEEGDMPF